MQDATTKCVTLPSMWVTCWTLPINWVKTMSTSTIEQSAAVRSDELVGWKPIAEYLGLKERAFWDVVHNQGLPCYRLNSRVYRFRLSEAKAWLEKRRMGAAA